VRGMTTSLSNVDQPAPSQPRPASPVLRASLWVAQVLLALAFGMAGVMKTTQPIADLALKMVWPGDVPPAMVRFIGVSEFLGAVGLILPAVTRIKPVFTPLAALGLVVIMVLAAAFHASRGELFALPMNVGFAALAAFIAWGRFMKAPIQAR
jgi:putative oxidoreductase